MSTTENTTSSKDLTLSEATNNDRKVFVKWTEQRGYGIHTVSEEIKTVSDLLKLMEAALTDGSREGLERIREARTGIPWNEDWNSAPKEAEETLGDLIEALNGGDDTIRIFDIPEFAELLEQFQAEEFNANSFPTAEQVSEILCDLWKREDKTTLEGETVYGALHSWDLREELPEGKEWKERFLKEVGFDSFYKPASMYWGGNGDLVWFLKKSDKEISTLFETLREYAEEDQQ